MNKYAQKMQEFGAKTGGIDLPPVPEELIEEAERQLGASLPPDYREFIRDYGFYGVDDPLFSFQRNGRDYPSDVGFFQGIAQTPFYRDQDIVKNRKSMLENREQWSPDWIPIADAGSALLALAISGDDYGKVFYFESGGGDYCVVAESFDEFMHLLRKNEE